MIDKDLSKYIDSKVVPMYKKHDRAHDEAHALEVIKASFVIAHVVKEKINMNILLASAALHDVGLKLGRDNHNFNSGKIIRRLNVLKKWFDKNEIEIIAQVAEDHRASLGITPRSIYGKIVADADRCSGYFVERLMERTWLYRIDNQSALGKTNNISDEDIFEDMFKHMHGKFGSKGYVKINLKETNIVYGKEIKRTRVICNSEEKARKLFYKMRKDGRLKR